MAQIMYQQLQPSALEAGGTSGVQLCDADAMHGPAVLFCPTCVPCVHLCRDCDAREHHGIRMSKHVRQACHSVVKCEGLDDEPGCRNSASVECVNCGNLCPSCDAHLHASGLKAKHPPRTSLLDMPVPPASLSVGLASTLPVIAASPSAASVASVAVAVAAAVVAVGTEPHHVLPPPVDPLHFVRPKVMRYTVYVCMCICVCMWFLYFQTSNSMFFTHKAPVTLFVLVYVCMCASSLFLAV
jgi:hypothetical protein